MARTPADVALFLAAITQKLMDRAANHDVFSDNERDIMAEIITELEKRVGKQAAQKKSKLQKMRQKLLRPHLPTSKSPELDIIQYMTANWKNQWWGMLDCDRCSRRGSNKWGTDAPCDTCPAWNHLVKDFRDGVIRS